MKKAILSIIILISLCFSVSSHIEHYSKFNYLEYELFRNNKSIGYHKYDFERNGNTLAIKSEVSFKITKLGVDLYKYFASSEEIYINNSFSKFSSKTKQNKKDKYVNISVDKDKDLIIDGSSYKGKADKDFIVGTWWNHEIVKAKAQISAISGRIIEQNVTFVGKEKIDQYGKTYEVDHFTLKSKDMSLPKDKRLNFDIWYDSKNFTILKVKYSRMGNWEYRLKNID